MATYLYYFSGTGNSRVVALDIVSHLPDGHAERITSAMLGRGLPADTDAVGVVAPVYHQGLPSIVAKWAASLPVKPEMYMFGVAAHGDRSPGVFFTQLATILRRRGLRLDAGFAVRMPHNVHGQSAQVRQTLVAGEKTGTAAIAEAIVSRVHTIPTVNPFLAPLLLATHRVGTVVTKSGDKDFRVTDACIGCDICAYVCPTDNIVMMDGRPSWRLQGLCEDCLACLQWCPRDAITRERETVDHYHHPSVKVHDMFTHQRATRTIPPRLMSPEE